MKPNPFSALNHFTVPCGISRFFLFFWVRGTAFRCPGPRIRPPYLAESPELHPTDNLAGTATATLFLRKFDTNTEAATAISQPCSSRRRQTCVPDGFLEGVRWR